MPSASHAINRVETDPRRRQPAGAVSAARRGALGSLLAFAAATVLASPASALTVATGQPVAITSTGATVEVTVNPGGAPSAVTVEYGVTGQPLSYQAEVNFTDTATSPETQTILLDQLQPGTSYTYQATGFTTDTSNLTATDPATASFTTSAAPTGPGLPVVPPQNPPNAIFPYPCDIAFENQLAASADAACVSDINGGRAAEGLAPLVLPGNWSALTTGEQLFVATNLERVVRGEPPIPDLVDTYDTAIQTAVQTFTDPSIAVTAPWTSVASTGSSVPLDAIYGWLYYDGPGGTNIDCAAPTDPGCWGHRDALLSDAATIGDPTEMDAGTGTSNGAPTAAAVFVANPTPTAAADVVFSWAGEQPFLAAPALGGAVSHRPAPTLSRAELSRATFAAEAARNAPALVLDTRLKPTVGTIVSYDDSERAITTLTVEQAVTGVLRHGRCEMASRSRPTTAKACTRAVRLGALEHADTTGANRFRFVGRLDGAELEPGRYVLQIAPRNADGRQGKAVTLAFAIVR